MGKDGGSELTFPFHGSGGKGSMVTGTEGVPSLAGTDHDGVLSCEQNLALAASSSYSCCQMSSFCFFCSTDALAYPTQSPVGRIQLSQLFAAISWLTPEGGLISKCCMRFHQIWLTGSVASSKEIPPSCPCAGNPLSQRGHRNQLSASEIPAP